MPAPLPNHELGHCIGKRTAGVNLSAYLDYVCPFSKKHYVTMRKEVIPHYKDKDFRYTFYHVPQPWHPQSSLTHEAGIAVAKVGGEDAFWTFSDKLFEQQELFFDLNVIDKTRPQIVAELAELAASSAGVPADQIAHLLSLAKIEGAKNPASNVAQELKWEVKHGRTMGIHVTPTNAINDIVFESSSSWQLDDWKAVLDPLLE